jgi:sulfate permease, SulP family
MSRSWASDLRQDAVGGLVSSAIAIPLAVGFGMFAFVALGDEYFAYGALAGLMSAFVVGVTCVLLGDRTPVVYAPRVPTTFFVGLLLYSLLHSDTAIMQSASLSLTLLIFFAIILLGGIFQALFGVMKLGALIKFAPHPVIAGFQNMAALLLFLVQLSNVLGYDRNIPFTHALAHMDSAKPLSVLIAAVTFAAMWNARKIATGVPPLLVGLGCGTAVYYALELAGYAQALGPLLGALPQGPVVPRPFSNFTDLAYQGHLAEIAPTILSGALALAVIAAFDALLCERLVSQPGDKPIDGDRLLIHLGVGNAIAACFGGITGGINIGASLTNRAFGARTPVSVLINAAVILAIIAVLFPYVAYLPRAVLSAVIMVVAVLHIDPWTTRLAARLFQRGTAQRGVVALDLFVTLLVSFLSIAINIVLAVFLGIVLAVFLFVVRMSRSNIRRLYRCDAVRSRKSRGAREMELLETKGSSILVAELQGALFFGSAERLAQEIDKATASKTQYLILDLRRVNYVDSTGARILADIEVDLADRGVTLALILSERSETVVRLAEFEGPNSEGRVFPDIDRAIEWTEDDLLRKTAPPAGVEIALECISLLQDFAPHEIETLVRHLRRVAWPKDSMIFKEGDPGSHLFIITKGQASVMLKSESRNIRLATFAPGTVFGELAILDKGPRSASIVADEDVVVYSLSETDFAALRESEPAVAIKILAGLGRELSGRLRRANRTIHQLEV